MVKGFVRSVFSLSRLYLFVPIFIPDGSVISHYVPILFVLFDDWKRKNTVGQVRLDGLCASLDNFMHDLRCDWVMKGYGTVFGDRFPVNL